MELYSKEKAGLRLLKSTMIKNGYTADIAEKSCVFTKKQKDSEQVQRIFVTIHPDFVTFRMELIPSSKYHFIKNEEVFDSNDEMLWKNKAVQEYRTTEELQNILKMIAFSMEKAGFQFLDHAAKDADDLYATHEEDMDLYLHHAEYVDNFKRQHHITCNEINVTFQKIKEALISLPSKPSQIERKQLLQIAAAYGYVYILQGGRWEMSNNLLCIKLKKKGSNREENMGNPLDWIYLCVSNNHRENVEYFAIEQLKSVGYL